MTIGQIYNIKGTHSPSFFISKNGPTLRQGSITPSNLDGEDGDLYIQYSSGNEQLYQKRSGIWIPFGSSSSSSTKNVNVITTSPYNVLITDDVVISNLLSPGPVNIILPPSVTVGKEFTIKDGKGDSRINNINISVSGSGTIDGLLNQIIDVNYESITIIYNGTEYNII